MGQEPKKILRGGLTIPQCERQAVGEQDQARATMCNPTLAHKMAELKQGMSSLGV